MDAELSELVGKTFAYVSGKDGDDEMVLVSQDGTKFRFFHEGECCEKVRIVDVVGDTADLLGHPMLRAEEVSSEGHPAPEDPDSYTWTFYKFETVKGSVTVRWLGESNGYYSEGVSLWKETA